MRTTIDIEDDVLAAAKELARLQNVSTGQIVSKLLRTALVGGGQPNGHGKCAAPDDETCHARFPLSNFPPEGERANESLREFRVKAKVSSESDF